MITVVSVSMAVQFVCVSFFFKAREHWECLSRKGPGVKVHVGPRRSLVHRVIRAQWCLSLQGNTPRFSW